VDCSVQQKQTPFPSENKRLNPDRLLAPVFYSLFLFAAAAKYGAAEHDG
jgi:hypothetical protein